MKKIIKIIKKILEVISKMFKKFVKDRAHNRYPAYCCDDIDERVGKLEEAVEALVAGTVPDGSITLAKLADDARTYQREINGGLLMSRWIGTREEYGEKVGDSPDPNVEYIITDDEPPVFAAVGMSYPVGSLITVRVPANISQLDKFINVGETFKNLFLPYTKITEDIFIYGESAVIEDDNIYTYSLNIQGTWRNCGRCGTTETGESAIYYLFQRIE